MPNIMRLRRRLPLVVFVLLAIVALMLLGVACACLTDQPMLNIERALSALPIVVDTAAVWVSLLALLGATVLAGSVMAPAAAGRSSPADLQRFRL